ncbi:DNA internalization-related competence protein ComEC/Rec2 [Oxalobacteraceae bacterium OM1]|nr:DNA internalization-related competence protein ComEC/Rec2 [Oxalobacteraceae bacterium OM1]
MTVVGTVASLPDAIDRGTRFTFDVERAAAPGSAPIPPRIVLSWYADQRRGDAQELPSVQPGERWQLTVRLRRPHGNANPDGFDYEAWLLEQGIRATGTVRNDNAANQRIAAFVPGMHSVVERARGWLRDRIFAALPGRPYAGVIVALVIGDQRGVSQSDWQVFNRTGIGHLVSISGLHITMIAGMAAALIGALWRRSFFIGSELPLRLPAQKAAALGGAVMACVYVLLAGFGVPAQRTLYMLCVVAFALWSGRMASVSHVLCAALAVVVLLDPWAVLWPGFWLSFGAVATILYASVGRAGEFEHGNADWRTRAWNTLHAGTHTQYVVTVGLVPLTMLLFGQISLVSPIANALAIPLISCLVTPLALAGSVAPAPLIGWLLGLAHWLVEQLAALLSWLSALPHAVWTAPLPAWWIFSCASLGMLWLLAPRGWPVRWLGLIGVVPLVLNVPTHPKAGQVWVTALDVGQGNALLVETANHRLLYDTGPALSPQSDAGSRVIVPYLKTRGIGRLDALMISHSDADHSGGARSVLEALPVGWVSTSLLLDHAIVNAAADHRRCLAGDAWTWDGVRFELLHPVPAVYESAKFKPNAHSCTVKITAGNESILLAGDIEATQEAELVERDATALRADVLLAPHHGSGTSSTLPFLQAVQPRIAVFQVGYRNRYHHPKPEIYARYADLGIERLRSDDAGAIALQLGDGVRAREYRKEHARYWYGR